MRRRPEPRVLPVALVMCLGGALGGVQGGLAQSSEVGEAEPSGAYLDPTAAALQRAARDEWERLDQVVISYRALVRQRIGAAIRTPLKDRTVYRAEAAHRVFWDKDGGSSFQVLALREQTPRGVRDPDGEWDLFDEAFDPTGDRLLFGLSGRSSERRNDDDRGFEVAHPLGPDAVRFYRFRSRDTVTLALPDGRRLRAIELQVIPRVADSHRISGSLWIEPSSGALVRAAYRLADVVNASSEIPDIRDDEDLRKLPGLLKPLTFELRMISVEYALWNFEAWLPRALRVEGVLGLGVFRATGTVDVSYRMESVLTEADLTAHRKGEIQAPADTVRYRTSDQARVMLEGIAAESDIAYEVVEHEGVEGWLLVPEDHAMLRDGPGLPPPIWDDAAGFPTEAELGDLWLDLQAVPTPPLTRLSWAANWGLQRPDLIRYNRIESLAVGARLQLRTGSPVGPVSLALEPFLGVADLDPRARLSLTRETLKRKDVLGAFHELRAASRYDAHLGLGNSMGALLWGRDEGEYFSSTGVDLTFSPPSALREAWSVRLYAEHQEEVDRHTDFSLVHAFEGDWTFRSNIEAERRDEIGLEAVLSPWWGTDPFAPQAGVEAYGHVAQGDGADDGYARASVLLRGIVPFRIRGRGLRTSLELEAGRSWGNPPLQREWYLGGVGSLRGYDASVLHAPSFIRARFELARVLPAASIAVFGDGGWVGPRPRMFRLDEGLVAVGVGVGLIDGLVRLDLSRGLRRPRDTRLDLHLDAAF